MLHTGNDLQCNENHCWTEEWHEIIDFILFLLVTKIINWKCSFYLYIFQTFQDIGSEPSIKIRRNKNTLMIGFAIL